MNFLKRLFGRTDKDERTTRSEHARMGTYGGARQGGAGAKQSGSGLLSAAAQLGSAEEVTQLLGQGFDVNERDAFSWTPLIRAAEHGDVSISEILLTHGAWPDLAAIDGATPIMHALWGATWAQDGQQDDITGRTYDGDHAGVIATLIAAGADVNQTDGKGSTALIMAAEAGRIKIVEALLGAGARRDAVNRTGGSALTQAAQGGHLGIVKLILAGLEPAVPQCRTALECAIVAGQRQVVETLIAAGVDPNQPSPASGSLPLVAAVEHGRREIAAFLIDHDTKVNAPDDLGVTALSMAAQDGDEALVTLLIERGADPNISNAQGVTPLMKAALQGFTSVAERLLAAGADVNARLADGRSAPDLARSAGHVALADALARAG